ncbi:MAG TPA: pitrilysin family protein [Methylomirabilota bacterium]|nr:pitrilysin family protein [Methylomirabilota bacterium]
MARFRLTVRWAWVLVLGALVYGCLTQRPSQEARVPVRPAREVLPNGVRLIIQQHRASDVVALQLWVGVGSRDEAPGERGFSHFVEHMLFKGTETRGRGFVEQEVESIGGRTNAGTSYEYTFYYILIPARHAVRTVEVLADMAFNSRFDPEELAREREVVFEEVRLGEDNPRSFLFRRLYNLAFDGHPYGFPVLGDPADLRSATQASLRGYYKRHYVAGNMTLVVVGAVDPGEIRAAALRSFGAVPTTGLNRVSVPPQPPIRGVRPQVVQRPERQGSLALGWVGPPLGHPDMYAVDLLAHILGGSRSSRLNQALRERAQIVSSVSAGYGALQGGGLVTVSAQFEPREEAGVESGVLAEIRRLQQEGVTEVELKRALTASEAGHVFSRETAEGLALAYGRAETTWSLDGERRYLERLRAVTRDQIREVARRYLTESYARLLFVPKGRGP